MPFHGDYLVGNSRIFVFKKIKNKRRQSLQQPYLESTLSKQSLERVLKLASYTCLRNHSTCQCPSDYAMVHPICESKETNQVRGQQRGSEL